MILHWLLLAIRYCSIVSLARAGFIDNSSKDGIVEATRYGYVYEGAGFIALMVSVVAGGWWLVVGAAGGGCGWWWVRLVVGAAGGGCGWWWVRLVVGAAGGRRGPLRSKVGQTTKIVSFSSLDDLLHAQTSKTKI